MNISLFPPLTKIVINQPFGTNYVNFYAQFGLKGHNGIDYDANNGTTVYAAHDGTVVTSGVDGDGGRCIEILTNEKGEGFKTIYYHLQDMIVNVGDKVKANQMIGHADNTGKYTTGSHLHFGLKFCINGVTQNKDNGYQGAIDPAPYFPKNYDKARAYHRYGRKANVFAEMCVRFGPRAIKNRWADSGRYIQSVSKRLKFLIPISGEMTNAIVYGGWDLNAIINPAMTQLWMWKTKDEFLKEFNNK